MKHVIWKGEARIIPNHGAAGPNYEIILPEALADNFINQGLAIEVGAHTIPPDPPGPPAETSVKKGKIK